MFAHHKEDDKIYHLTLTEIGDAERKDQELKVYFKKHAKMPQTDIGLHFIKDTKVLCKNGKIIIRTSLRHRAVSWYHHYLPSRRDDEIPDVLERYSHNHPEIYQN
jgi:hypothetical protein